MKNTKTASLEEIRAMQRRGKVKAPSDDAEALDMPDGFWDDADIVERQPKQSVHLRVDAEVLEYFKSGGKGHLTRMNAVLRTYVEAQRSRG
ncbi:BrnA antitoxin family protein [Ruegeria sp. Alg231-54]|uniref:BrnA antitoxin family protein n=1 Tax=Ruegeria sp. Alg231-54 TaxID=1922221 RepID=UPI001F472491|nr:BrnA antitoxin family protein [Ruegeria sp. Alg231-54]